MTSVVIYFHCLCLYSSYEGLLNNHVKGCVLQMIHIDIVFYEVTDRKIKLEYMKDGKIKKTKFSYRQEVLEEIDNILHSAVIDYTRRTTSSEH